MQSSRDQHTPTRVAFDKREEKSAFLYILVLYVLSLVRSANEFSRKRLSSVLTDTLCSACPICRPIVPFKRSRTIELPSSSSILSPARASNAPSVRHSSVSLLRNRASATVYPRGRSCSRGRERNPQPKEFCMYGVHLTGDRGGLQGLKAAAMVGTALVVPLKSQRHSRDIYHNSRRSTYFPLEARGTGTSSPALSFFPSPSLSLSLPSLFLPSFCSCFIHWLISSAGEKGSGAE